MSFSVLLGAIDLPNVRAIQRGSAVAPDVWVNTTNRVGRNEVSIIVEGIIFGPNRRSIKGVSQQATALNDAKTLEDSLIAAGTATLTFGTQSITGARLIQFDVDRYQNNPVMLYKATFAVGHDNPFAETVTIQDTDGTTTLTPIPDVDDEYIRQDEVITWASQGISAAKRIKLRGAIAGSPTQVDATETEIIGRLTDDATVTVTIPSGAYTCKVVDFKFRTPNQTSRSAVKEYEIEFITEKNYTLESENLPHTPVSWAGITFDVTNSYSSSVQRELEGGSYIITNETLQVTGLIYFSSFAAAEAYRDTAASATVTPITLTSPTGKVLVATSVNANVAERVGRDTSGDQRYQISVSITFEWRRDIADRCVTTGESLFGVVWGCITSKSFSGTVNLCGLKTQDTLSVNGVLNSIPSFEVGSSHEISGKTYYITNFAVTGRDDQSRYQVNVSARTLDTFEQATQFLAVTLPSGETLQEISSHSRSVTYKFSVLDGYRSTSVNINISGFAYVGGGTADGFLDLVNIAGQVSGLQLNQFRITNVSVGRKEPFIDQTNCTIGQRQSVSAAYVLNFEPDGSASGGQQPGEATIVEEDSIEIKQISNKYQQIQIPGGSLNFKKTGLNPGSVKITRTRRRVGGDARVLFDYPNEIAPPAGPEEMFVSEDTFSATSSTRRRVKEWTVLKGNITLIVPSPGTIITVIPPSST